MADASAYFSKPHMNKKGRVALLLIFYIYIYIYGNFNDKAIAWKKFANDFF